MSLCKPPIFKNDADAASYCFELFTTLNEDIRLLARSSSIPVLEPNINLSTVGSKIYNFEEPIAHSEKFLIKAWAIRRQYRTLKSAKARIKVEFKKLAETIRVQYREMWGYTHNQRKAKLETITATRKAIVIRRREESVREQEVRRKERESRLKERKEKQMTC